jgi:hypothetical protein
VRPARVDSAMIWWLDIPALIILAALVGLGIYAAVTGR